MGIEVQKFPYPGDEATPQQLLQLADEYRRAAQTLAPTGRRGEPLSLAPFRLLALQALELYLDALLRHRGVPPTKLRGLPHNLSARTVLAVKVGLTLKKRTEGHLHSVVETREYLRARYGPEASGNWSQPNRLESTLAEVAKKVTALVAKGTALSAK